MPPAAPAGTITAIASMAPYGILIVDTNGCAIPVGHVLRNPSGPVGAAVKFNEYARALPGIPQAERMGKVRLTRPASAGPPSDPAGRRVSAIRHGVTG